MAGRHKARAMASARSARSRDSAQRKAGPTSATATTRCPPATPVMPRSRAPISSTGISAASHSPCTPSRAFCRRAAAMQSYISE